MKSLLQTIKQAERKKIAIGHFNFSEFTVLRAIMGVAKKLKTPVIVGMSEGEREFFGLNQAVALVESFRKEGALVFLNADHTKSFQKAKEAIDASFDAVLFDGGRLSLRRNIAETKKVVQYARKKNQNIVIEGELGYIGGSSQILSEVPRGAAVQEDQLTTIEEAKQFIKETGVDMLAPAVGTVHGIVSSYQPRLHLERIKDIKKAVRVPLVLHGASGVNDEAVQKAIKAGMSVVHINTEIRAAWRRALESSLNTSRDELAPYHILDIPQAAAAEVIEKKLKVFNEK
ncbi:MAG: class II fructose-bisphosphate aldolase [Patescibacteria group bacterium]